MSATTDHTSLEDVRDMTETERRAWNREFYLPSTRVWTAQAPDGTEQIYIGQIESPSIYDPDLDTEFEITDYVCPPKAMGIEELLEWIWSAPHGLQIRLDATLPDALGETVDIVEAYPPIELTEARR